MLIGPQENDPRWAAIRGGAQRHAKAIPYLTFDYVAPVQSTTQALQDVVSDVISRKPVAVCLYVADPVRARPAAERLFASGISLVTMGVDIPGLTPYGRVYVKYAEGAELLGKNLERIAAGGRSYVLVHANDRSDLATRCYERFMLTARRSAVLTLLEDRTVLEGQDGAAAAVRELLERFPRTGLVVTLTPTPWLETPPTTLPAQRRFATLGAVPALWPRLRAREAAALVGPLDGDIGYTAIELALLSLTGEEPAGIVRFVPCHLVTAENLEEFVWRYATAAGTDLRVFDPPTSASRPTSVPDGQ
ncbi:MAG: substrate-binding domain-containing protein [Planctomycetes bacterium]|nr:substrate-binding domain-containing protein [Planctomycetota bacterium]